MSRSVQNIIIATQVIFCFLNGVGCQEPKGYIGPVAGEKKENNVGTTAQSIVDSAEQGGKREIVMAEINGERLTAEELTQFAREMNQGFKGKVESEWHEAVDTLINNRLLARKAVSDKVAETPRVKSKLEIATNSLWEEPYWNTIVRPTVKLTKEDLAKNAPLFEELVTVRQMVVSDKKEAELYREQVLNNPEGFAELIRGRSEGLSAAKGGLVPNISRHSVQYSKEILGMLLASKEGDVSPVVESPIGYTFFQTVKKISSDEARADWEKTVSNDLLRDKSRIMWEKHLDVITKKRKVKIYEDTLLSFSKALEQKKGMTQYAAKPICSVDNTIFYLADVVDPSGTGVIHGEQTVRDLVKKRINQYSLSQEFEMHKKRFPTLILKENHIRENILARAYIDYRSKDIRVDEKTVRRYYQENRGKYVQPLMYDISAIETRSEDRLEKIYNQLASGKEFGVVAEEWSDNKEKFPEGHVGLIPQNRISKEFAVIKTMKPGQYTTKPVVLPVVEKEGSLYVVLRLNRIESERTVPYSEVNKSDIRKAILARERERIVRKVMEEIRQENKVIIRPEYYKFVAEMGKKGEETGQ